MKNSILNTCPNFGVHHNSSHDDIVSLKGRIDELLRSNSKLAESIGHLNFAVNELKDEVHKLRK
jgi:hypothetical protein